MTIDSRHLDARLRGHSALRLLRAGLPRGSRLAWTVLGRAVDGGFEAETLGLLGREVVRARLNESEVAAEVTRALAAHPGLERVLETWRRSAADAEEAAPHYSGHVMPGSGAALEDLELALAPRGEEKLAQDLVANGGDMNLAVLVEDALRDEEADSFARALVAIHADLDPISRRELAHSWLAPLLEGADEEARETIVAQLIAISQSSAGQSLIAELPRGDIDEDTWRRLQDSRS
jgi:hypothetical protein